MSKGRGKRRQRPYLMWGAALLGTGIILGAMAAHRLEKLLEPDKLEALETGVRYQMWMGLALLALPAIPHFTGKLAQWSLRLILVGVLLFSFSIYILSLENLFDISATWLGPVTPVGGSLMIIGWIFTVIALSKGRK